MEETSKDTQAGKDAPEAIPVQKKPPTDWAAIEKAAVAGVTYDILSQKYEVPESTIRSRASIYAWPVNFRTGPRNPTQQIAQAKASNEAAQALINASLEQIQAEHPLRVARYASSKMKEALESDLLPAPSSWKEANVVDTMVRRAIGLDKPQVAIQINAWHGSAGLECEEGGQDVSME